MARLWWQQYVWKPWESRVSGSKEVRDGPCPAGYPAGADVPAGLAEEVLKRIHHLLQDGALEQACFERGGGVTTTQLQGKRRGRGSWLGFHRMRAHRQTAVRA